MLLICLLDLFLELAGDHIIQAQVAILLDLLLLVEAQVEVERTELLLLHLFVEVQYK